MENNKNGKAALRIGQVLFLAILLGIAEYLVDTGKINKMFLAAPSGVVAEFYDIITQNILWPHVLITVHEFFAGYTVAVAAGIVLGVVFVAFPKLDEFFTPFLSSLMAIPKVAIIPLLIVWFGIGLTSKMVLVFLFTFFVIFFNTRNGAKQTSANYIKVAKVFGATKWQTIFKLLIPAAMPSIITGLHITATTGLTGVIFAEITASKAGLGYLLQEANSLYNTPRMFVVIFVVTVLSQFFVWIVSMLEKRVFLKWQRP